MQDRLPPPEAPRAPLDVRADSLRHVFATQIEAPPRGDPFIRAYALAAQGRLDVPGPIRDFFYYVLEQQPTWSDSYVANKIRSALQDHLYLPVDRGDQHDESKRFRLQSDLSYPQDYATPEAWVQAFEGILADPDIWGEFMVDVLARPLASNISERYKGLKAFANLAHNMGRLGVFSVMDVGCSQNAGLNHLASGIPFERVSFIRPGSPTFTPSLPHTTALNAIINEPFPLQTSVGIDRYHPKDSRSWARACSHYPSELLDHNRVAMYDQLIMANYNTVLFYRSDFVTFDHAAFTQQHGDRQFNIVNFSTVLYQAGSKERAAMLAHAERIAKEFIVVQDFVAVNKQDPTQLNFRNDWQDDPFPYRTVIRDMREERPIWHEIFRWRDGRCREMTFNIGRIAVENGLRASLWTPFDSRARRTREW